jgi:hypothetical protein
MREIASSPSHTQRAHFEALGFVSEMTTEPTVAEWSGYGLRLTVQASLVMTQRETLQLIISAARAAGKTEQQANAREALGIITGIKL